MGQTSAPPLLSPYIPASATAANREDAAAGSSQGRTQRGARLSSTSPSSYLTRYVPSGWQASTRPRYLRGKPPHRETCVPHAQHTAPWEQVLSHIHGSGHPCQCDCGVQSRLQQESRQQHQHKRKVHRYHKHKRKVHRHHHQHKRNVHRHHQHIAKSPPAPPPTQTKSPLTSCPCPGTGPPHGSRLPNHRCHHRCRCYWCYEPGMRASAW